MQLGGRRLTVHTAVGDWGRSEYAFGRVPLSLELFRLTGEANSYNFRQYRATSHSDTGNTDPT